MKKYYRIVRDGFAGYEVQKWRWYWPFWVEVGINTHNTIDSAERFIDSHSAKVVKTVTIGE